jgi:hypothetical protein
VALGAAGATGVGGRIPDVQVVAFSTPQTPLWRWRIVNYAGELVEESRDTFPTIAGALEQGSKRMRLMDVVDHSVPYQPHRSTRHLRLP